MRHGSNSRRTRRGGGNRRPNPRTQTFDSNGPDVRIRGTAYQITEKYMALAKDAAAAGDAVLAESYLQHAEHYQRIINTMTEQIQQSDAAQPEVKEEKQKQKPVRTKKSDELSKDEETEGLLAVLKADEMLVPEKETVEEKPKRTTRRKKNPESEKMADPV